MICLTNCFGYHILGQIMLLSSTASYHDMRCLWCDRTSGRCFFVCDENFVSSVLMCLAEETFVVPLCFALSEVKLCFALSDVQHFPPCRWGESQLLIFVVWRLRKCWPGVSKLAFVRHRPYKMGLLVEGVIGHE
jgi:hypothetical protein